MEKLELGKEVQSLCSCKKHHKKLRKSCMCRLPDTLLLFKEPLLSRGRVIYNLVDTFSTTPSSFRFSFWWTFFGGRLVGHFCGWTFFGGRLVSHFFWWTQFKRPFYFNYLSIQQAPGLVSQPFWTWSPTIQAYPPTILT